MGAPDARTLLRAPGRLAFGCTSLATAWPHGGTGLGNVKGIELRNYSVYFTVTAEEYAGDPVEFLQRGTSWGIGAFCRGADDDLLARLFPNSAAGTVTQHRRVTEPGSAVKAGMRMSTGQGNLVFTPYDTDRIQTVVLYRAVPLVEEQAALVKLAVAEDYGTPALFMGIRDNSGRVIDWGRKEDLSL